MSYLKYTRLHWRLLLKRIALGLLVLGVVLADDQVPRALLAILFGGVALREQLFLKREVRHDD